MKNLGSNKLFWMLQVVGWFSYYLIYAIITTYYKPFNGLDLILYSLTYILGFVITVGLRYPYRILYNKIEKLYWLPVVIVIGSVITTILWTFIDIYASHFFWENGELELKRRMQASYLINYSFLYIILMTSWSSLYFGIKYALDWQKEKNHVREAESLAQKAQMEMLRYQLNPHFLFNSLNSIRALVDENQAHAKEMITELSEFLRYSLLHKDATFVTLMNELEAVKHYFAIEKTRFEEKLEIEYNIADEVRNSQILTFLLHPLIENAVKYGMKTSTMPLKIGINAQKTGYGLLIEICNSGVWVDRNGDENHSGGTGTGMKNVEKRLKSAYKDDYRFEIIKGETNICIRIEIKEQYLNG